MCGFTTLQLSKQINRILTGPGKSVEFEKCPEKSWNFLGVLYFFEKLWKSPGILEKYSLIFFIK